MHNLLLADDDMDDCLFFQEAMEEISTTMQLTTVNDGVQLMNFLSSNKNQLPDIIFLDLNMPRKSGMECLTEIKLDNCLKQLPIVIISTSMDTDVINKLYLDGAHYYIRKPGDFALLKQVIQEATTRLSDNKTQQPERSNFIIQP